MTISNGNYLKALMPGVKALFGQTYAQMGAVAGSAFNPCPKTQTGTSFLHLRKTGTQWHCTPKQTKRVKKRLVRHVMQVKYFAEIVGEWPSCVVPIAGYTDAYYVDPALLAKEEPNVSSSP